MEISTSAVILVLTLYTIIICEANAEVVVDSAPGSSAIRDLRERIQEHGGCEINVCFAIDGSASISKQEFEAEKILVSLISRAILDDDNDVRLGAVQFAVANTAITPLTSNGTEFLEKVSKTRQTGEEETFIGGSILYCSDQIRGFPDDSNKMILLSDGGNTIGFEPFDRADIFRELGGELLAIGIGSADKKALLQIVNGIVENLLLLDATSMGKGIEDVFVKAVERICGLEKQVEHHMRKGSASLLS